MSNDNVTPFRRPPPRPVRPQQSGGMGLKTHRGKVVLVHLLTIACFVTPFLLPGQLGYFVGVAFAIAAGVVAYTSRMEAMPWAATHHEQAIRTLVIAFVTTMVLGLPRLVVSQEVTAFWQYYNQVYFWCTIIVYLWAGIRALIGLVLAGMRKPVPNPRGWLV